MATDRRTLLRKWRARLTTDPIDPTDPEEDRYVPLQEAGRGAVDGIFLVIDLALDPTTQLLSGPRGSGKTTELKRLAGRLQEAGFAVVMVDILGFVNQSSEIDITEFLIALALAFEEGLPADQQAQQDGFGARFRGFLQRTKVTIGAGPVSATASTEGLAVGVPGLSVDIDLKKELKSSEPFVKELRTKLAFHLGELHREVASFFTDRVRRHKEENLDSLGVVMIVDSLEKLRGTTENDEQVQASVEGLFVHHSDKLRFKSHHMVYTVPPYLMFTDPGSLPYDGTVRPVPIPQVRDRKGDEVEKIVNEMALIVGKRIPWEELLSTWDLLKTILFASGGHLRDLFRILQELIIVTGRGVPLPAEAEHVDEAIANVALGFSKITKEDADFLRRVHDEGGVLEPRADEVGRLARLIDTHMLLEHLNGDAWYEVHPLARRTLGLP